MDGKDEVTDGTSSHFCDSSVVVVVASWCESVRGSGLGPGGGGVGGTC